jgi:L-threonylcarbamoyladenylate synthase
MTGSNPQRQSQIMRSDALGIAEAATLLRNGAIVAVPTETVYGLAADARNANAVAAIFRAKGRPDFNPLIVHVPDRLMAGKLAQFSELADRLATAFWPGPFTMVLPLVADAPIAKAVTAGLSTIALRCPAHPAMQGVLLASGLCLAAPSANRSGGISPTCAEHVTKSLSDCAPFILDGGACRAGIESTIVAIRDNGWQLLRPGPITGEMITAVAGCEAVYGPDMGIEAPGQLASHYAPVKALRLNALKAEADEWLIGFGTIIGDDNLSSKADLAEAAAHLYDALHRADASIKNRIAIAPIPDDGIGIALNDRIRRAAAR